MTPASILVVKPSSLGDVVHTLPSVHCLKRSFPEAQIRWIVNSEWKPLLEDNRDLAEVIPFSRKSFRGLEGLPRFLSLGARLSRLRPDLVLDFQGLLRSAWIARSARGKQILGLSDAREGARLFYHATAQVHAHQHAVDRYLELAKLAGADVSGRAIFNLPKGRVIPKLVLPEPLIVLHPFARGTGKSLTSNEIHELTRALEPLRVVIVGRTAHNFHCDRNAISLVNQTDLSQLIWLLRQSSFVVSVDSGPMHIAAAISKNLLSIHFWSDPRSVGPYRKDAWVWRDQKILRIAQIEKSKFRRGAQSRPDMARIAALIQKQL